MILGKSMVDSNSLCKSMVDYSRLVGAESQFIWMGHGSEKLTWCIKGGAVSCFTKLKQGSVQNIQKVV